MEPTTKNRLIGLAGWILLGPVILTVGQGFLIAGADGHRPINISLGLLIDGTWVIGVWGGCYKLLLAISSDESPAGASVKAAGGAVLALFLIPITLRHVAPLLRPKPTANVDFFWKRLDRTNSFAVATFIRQNSDSPHVGEAREILKTLEASDWKRIQAETDPNRKTSELDLYLRMDPTVYPYQHREEAKNLLDDVEWKGVLSAAQTDQRERARNYLILHKDGKHAMDAAKMTQ